MVKIEDDGEKKWLLRSSAKILGPFTLTEIAHLLIKKNVSIIDEVRQPSGRWTYIRENPIFNEIVENLRTEQAHSAEETVTTATLTQTASKTSLGSEEETETAPPLVRTNDEEVLARPNAKDVTPLKDFSKSADLKKKTHEKSFGATGDQRVQRQIENKSRAFGFFLWGITILLAAAVSFIVFMKVRGTSDGYEDYVAEALRYKHLQLYDKALSNYKKAQSIKDPDENFAFKMALIMIQKEKQTLMARRILEKGISQPGISKDEMVDAYSGVALSYSLEGDLKASNDYLQKALSLSPGNFPASINRAYNELMNGSYESAAKIFEGMLPTATFAPYVYLGKALLAAESENKATPLVVTRLSESVLIPNTFRKEQNLLLTYLHHREGKHEEMIREMKRVIDTPLKESETFAKDLRVDRRVSTWEYLEKYCSEIFVKEEDVALSRAFRAICLLEQGRDAEAKGLLDEALVQEPTNPYVVLAHSHYLVKVGRHREALTQLRKPELSELNSPMLLIANSCAETKDINCARKISEAGLQKFSGDVRYMTNWAIYHYGASKSPEVWDVVKKAFEVNSNYIPLIELRDRMENP